MQTLMILLQSLAGLMGGGDDSAAAEGVKATGNIAADVSEWKGLSLNEFINLLAQKTAHLLINVAVAVLVFYAGRFIIRRLYRLVSAIFVRRELDKSLSVFILSMLNIVLYFILIVTVIGILGIETTSFLALFASAGVAIGMALSGTLQNFAGGVLILLLKPYKVGDYIEAQGYSGTVREIQIFFTVLTTPDFKTVLIPNGSLSTGSLNNWTRQNYRRVSWTISISYGDNVAKARQAILEMLLEDTRVEKGSLNNAVEIEEVKGDGATARKEQTDSDARDASVKDQGYKAEVHAPAKRKWYQIFSKGKEQVIEAKEEWKEEWKVAHNTDIVASQYVPNLTPQVVVSEMGASSVDLTVRAWVNTPDYWDVYYRYNERFYTELPERGGVNFPFPQMDVHIDGVINK